LKALLCFFGFSPSRQVAKNLVLRIFKTKQKTLRPETSELRPEPSGLREKRKMFVIVSCEAAKPQKYDLRKFKTKQKTLRADLSVLRNYGVNQH
jgi:hypothetical protein